MAVHEIGKQLEITDGAVTLKVFLDADGKIVISNLVFGARISPEDLRKVLHELAPEPVAEILDEDALFAALHEYRRCSEDQARGIIGAYLAALRSKPCD